jgi:hypothetical protein
VGVGVNVTMMFGTLQVVGLTEAGRTSIRFRKKLMNLCVYNREECERGTGTPKDKDEVNRREV